MKKYSINSSQVQSLLYTKSPEGTHLRHRPAPICSAPAGTGSHRETVTAGQVTAGFRRGRAKLVHQKRDFVCGWGAALVETVCTYPFSKLVVRQQLQGINFARALDQLRREGVYSLYRGILPPLLQRTSARCLMFGTYDEYCYQFGCGDRSNFCLCRSMAAFMAGCTEAILCPFERIQTVLQSPRYNGMYTNALDVFLKLRRYGLAEYYRGLVPIVLRNGCSNVLFFSLRGPLKELVSDSAARVSEANSDVVHGFGDFVCGALLGALISTIFYPLNMLKTRKQATVGGPFESLSHSLRQVLNERSNSVRKLYYGVHVNYTRSMITWGITNAVYEFLERHLYHTHLRKPA